MKNIVNIEINRIEIGYVLKIDYNLDYISHNDEFEFIDFNSALEFLNSFIQQQP